MSGIPGRTGSAANAEFLDQVLIARLFLALEVVEQLTTLRNRVVAMLNEINSSSNGIMEWNALQRDLDMNGEEIRAAAQSMKAMQLEFGLDSAALRAELEV